MSISYTALNQGQDDNRRNQPSESHLSNSAPMARAEIDDINNHDEEAHRVTTTNHNNGDNVSHNNVPNISVTDAFGDEKSNHIEGDHIDGHLGDDLHTGDSTLHLREFRAGTPHSTIRTPHLGLNFDTELGSLAGETIPDINVYQHKKTLAQGMMDLALFSANANQLRYVLDSYARHPYYWPSFIFIVLSLALQVAVGVGLIWNSSYNIKNEKDLCLANKINNFTVIGIFLVVVLNVFISVFGVIGPQETFVQIPVTSSVLVQPVTSTATIPL